MGTGSLVSPAAFAAVTGCGVFFAIADFTRKKASAVCAPELLVALVFSLIAPVYGLLLLVTGAWQVTPGYVLPAAVNIVADTLANVFFIRAVAASPLSRVIPLLSLTPVLTSCFAALFLGEAMIPQQWAGIFLVVAGIFCLYAPEKQLMNPVSVIRGIFNEKGARYILCVVAFWTVAMLCSRVALRHASVPLNGFVQFTVSAALLWLWLLMRGGLRGGRFPARKDWKIIGILAFFYAAALGTQMMALKMVYAGIVDSVKRVMAQVSALVLGRIFFHEHITAAKLAALALMCVGVPLVIFRI